MSALALELFSAYKSYKGYATAKSPRKLPHPRGPRVPEKLFLAIPNFIQRKFEELASMEFSGWYTREEICRWFVLELAKSPTWTIAKGGFNGETIKLANLLEFDPTRVRENLYATMRIIRDLRAKGHKYEQTSEFLFKVDGPDSETLAYQLVDRNIINANTYISIFADLPEEYRAWLLNEGMCRAEITYARMNGLFLNPNSGLGILLQRANFSSLK